MHGRCAATEGRSSSSCAVVVVGDWWCPCQPVRGSTQRPLLTSRMQRKIAQEQRNRETRAQHFSGVVVSRWSWLVLHS